MVKQQGLALTRPDGQLKQFTKMFLESALDEGMSEHLGRCEKHQKTKDGPAETARNGVTRKTVIPDLAGPVALEVLRDSDTSFELVTVKKRQRRLNDVDEVVVLSLHAKGLTTGEIHGTSVFKETVSRITEAGLCLRFRQLIRVKSRIAVLLSTRGLIVVLRVEIGRDGALDGNLYRRTCAGRRSGNKEL